MLAQLEAQAAELQAIYERAQQQLQEQWQGYREVYEKACAMQQVRFATACRQLAESAYPVHDQAGMLSHRLYEQIKEGSLGMSTWVRCTSTWCI